LQRIKPHAAHADTAPADGVDLEASTQSLIAILANRLTRNISSYCRKYYKIGSIEQRILMLLRKQQDLSSSQIAVLTDLDKAAVSRSLTTLLAGGLVDLKSIHHQSRIKLVSLTPKGVRTVQELSDAVGERHAEMFRDFSKAEQQAFRRAVQKLILVSSEPTFKPGKRKTVAGRKRSTAK